MKVLLLSTWDIPKSDEGQKKWQEFDRSIWYKRLEKYKVKASSWIDGSGDYVYLMEFESFEHYAKFMDDKELQNYIVEHCRIIENVKMRVLREVY